MISSNIFCTILHNILLDYFIVTKEFFINIKGERKKSLSIKFNEIFKAYYISDVRDDKGFVFCNIGQKVSFCLLLCKEFIFVE